jgi:hypothetical protein
LVLNDLGQREEAREPKAKPAGKTIFPTFYKNLSAPESSTYRKFSVSQKRSLPIPSAD